eukprot:8256696-Pyramimonas_sp.AAC.1
MHDHPRASRAPVPLPGPLASRRSPIAMPIASSSATSALHFMLLSWHPRSSFSGSLTTCPAMPVGELA